MKLKDIIYIVFILVLIFFLTRTERNGENNDVITIDSTKVDFVIPKDSGQFVSKNPKPIRPKVILVSDSLKYQRLIKNLSKKLNKAIDSTDILKELLAAKQIREYKKTYEDSSIVAEFYEKVEGKLLERRFSYVKKSQKITYYNKTTTIEKYPDYAFYLGLNFQSVQLFQAPAIGLNLSYQNKAGNILTVGYASNDFWMLDYKFRIFVKY